MLVVVALFGTKSVAAFFSYSGPEPNHEMPTASGMPLAERPDGVDAGNTAEEV